ncbi:hypothetical protein BCR35DRAFT_311220 [Leucosporidium creatinivorum]|uniref:Uncharacterized protein n=1 Tax=Leucosporidium creatinivorum TaxID=106004 RepID=A0A1Y2C889_9BASI|nr:hypothetical protein BCR35DRAFT_311220 [Leucosporidium creatinivorum]
MLARERMMKDQALTGGQGPSGYGDGQQQHQFGAPKAGMSQWGPMGPAAPLHQQPTSYAYGGHPHRTCFFSSVIPTQHADSSSFADAATPAAAAQGHPPGSFPISHPQQHTPRPGPIHTKEDRSLSGNAFSMGTPAFSSMHWPAGAPSTSAGNMPAPGVVGGGNGGAGGDEEALKQLSELQKQLEENLKLQEAQGPAPKGAAGGAEKEQQQPTPAASGWFPKLW